MQMETRQKRIFPVPETVCIAIAFFLLFMGVGRIFSLVLHDPVIAYANSYDMIPLQACHQIWPAVPGVDIRKGTPAAPLRPYSITQHVDTPCLPSSELLFTWTAIKLANLKNIVTGSKLVSIKTVGTVKAVFLAVTAILFQLFLYRRRQVAGMCLHALVVLLVLSDPGLTLYLSTFYTQFSAAYFLYVLVAGLVVLQLHRRHYFFPGGVLLCAGLLGLGLSMPQHAALALILGLILAAYYFRQKSPLVAGAVLVFAVVPYCLQSGNWLAPANERLDFANRSNVFSAMLESSPDKSQAAAILKLPEACTALAGRKSYEPELIAHHPCKEIQQVSNRDLALLLVVQPSLPEQMLVRAMPELAGWIIRHYGQVEGEKFSSASSYYWSIAELTASIPASWLPWFLCAPAVCWLLLLFSRKATAKKLQPYECLCGLMMIAQWAALWIALLSFGFVDVTRNAHLAVLLAACNLTGIFFPGLGQRRHHE
ncbi:MAG TPA: hypothetical protein PLF22_01110 [Pseudomonadales bacterium]|nr:hypothetical protein [Pseudomonadales bacterium]